MIVECLICTWYIHRFGMALAPKGLINDGNNPKLLLPTVMVFACVVTYIRNYSDEVCIK